MSCEVGPAGLATTRMPSSPGPSDERATVSGRARRRAGVASARTGGRASSSGASIGRAGRPGVAAAAEPAGQDGRVDAAGLASGR